MHEAGRGEEWERVDRVGGGGQRVGYRKQHLGVSCIRVAREVNPQPPHPVTDLAQLQNQRASHRASLLVSLRGVAVTSATVASVAVALASSRRMVKGWLGRARFARSMDCWHEPHLRAFIAKKNLHLLCKRRLAHLCGA